MSCPFNEEQLTQLNAFVDLCKAQPLILHHPKLAFFKDYLVSLGVRLPTATFGSKPFTASGDGHPPTSNLEENAAKPASSESEESDLELDMEGVITSADSEATQEMGDPSKEVTDEERDQSDEKRTAAMEAFSKQEYEEAIALYTEAIKLNPQSAVLFAKRGQAFLKLNKLHACIKDCSHTLELNCDSAAAYKFRGRAYRLLGSFENASHDLCESLKIDYDDQVNEWLSEIKPNADKIRQHKLSRQRRKEDKEHSEKLRRAREAQEAETAKKQANPAAGGPFNMPTNLPSFFANVLNNPEMMAAFEDPEVMNAFYDVSSNPANFAKYQNNPKIAAVFEMFHKKFGNTAFAKDFPAGAQATGATSKPYDDDVGLD
ncbi:putative protein FAM10A4 [Zerene cesonia]|uniref:putative protein FAM10A4 n=1 Tax=Zerene cesonia TaxID=33412 RepID=UPI0018E5532E|nr:putative protein FAM10A4 [Zerene cesonia]